MGLPGHASALTGMHDLLYLYKPEYARDILLKIMLQRVHDAGGMNAIHVLFERESILESMYTLGRLHGMVRMHAYVNFACVGCVDDRIESWEAHECKHGNAGMQEDIYIYIYIYIDISSRCTFRRRVCCTEVFVFTYTLCACSCTTTTPAWTHAGECRCVLTSMDKSTQTHAYTHRIHVCEHTHLHTKCLQFTPALAQRPHEGDAPHRRPYTSLYIAVLGRYEHQCFMFGIYIYIYIYVCMYVCMYICVCMYL